MSKRHLTAIVCFVLATSLQSAAGVAKSYKGEARDLKSRAITSPAGTSRSCLTSAARALLGRIESQFGPMRVVSTCRPGAVIAGSGHPSKHASGQAIDFDVPHGRKAEVVRWLIANHKSGGTMTYSGMSHVHVDVGAHFVSLGSGGGSRSASSGRSSRTASRRDAGPAKWAGLDPLAGS